MYLLFIWFQGLAFLSLGSRSPSGQLPAILQLHRVSEVLYPLICWTTSDHLCTTTYIRTQERFSQIPRIRQFSHHTFNKCKPWCQSDGIMSDSAMCPISFKHPKFQENMDRRLQEVQPLTIGHRRFYSKLSRRQRPLRLFYAPKFTGISKVNLAWSMFVSSAAHGPMLSNKLCIALWLLECFLFICSRRCFSSLNALPHCSQT